LKNPKHCLHFYLDQGVKLKNDMKKLSIVISTYNRPALYDRVIKSIKSHLIKDVEVVKVEGVAGLAKARNLGWKQAKGDYVAYIDDDAVATSDWVENILGFIKKHSDVVVFGGPYTSYNASSLPSWIPTELTVMEIRTKVARPIVLPHEWLTGTNMIFRKNVLKELGGFDEKLGVTPTRRSYGEETDLLIRINNAGYPIWYDPKIKVLHEFALSKTSLLFLLKDQFTHGYNSHDTFKNLVKSDPVGTAGTAFSRLSRPSLELKTRVYFLLSPFAYLAGSLLGKISSSLR
jgi:glycosyltransferase involved in cell wall biosynthesis